jgi:ribulose 1,5-bisphosphate synthetase/thiazole synthase
LNHPVFSADEPVDVVIYGGTSAGISAAIQAARMGKTSIIIEPSKHLGGLTTGGLGATDTGSKEVIGGISREFYQRLRKHYDKPESWNLEKRDSFKMQFGPSNRRLPIKFFTKCLMNTKSSLF